MAEEEAKKPEDAAGEAKGLAEKFVQTLGLVDLIIGALALYWMRLWFGAGVGELLPTTSYPWVDIALLGCAAAFVGKIISTAADLFAAAIDVSGVLAGPSKRLADALGSYKAAIEDTSRTDEEIDTADTYLISANSRLEPRLENLYNASTLAYSMMLLSFLFMLYFWNTGQVGRPKVLIAIQAAATIAFLIYGVVKQADYLNTIARNLNHATAMVNLKKKERGAIEAGRSITVNLSAPSKLPLELAAVNFSLKQAAVDESKERSE